MNANDHAAKPWTVLTWREAMDLIEAHHVVGPARATTGADLHLMLGNGRVLVRWDSSDQGPADWWLMQEDLPDIPPEERIGINE